MKNFAALLLSAAALISGCADFGAPYHAADPEQKKQHEPVDRNRNGVPDGLERKAVPLAPVIDQPLTPVDEPSAR